MDTTLYFPNLATAYLFYNELSGQISDGKYENSKPYDHWEWVCHTIGIYNPEKVGYKGPFHRIKTYNLREWPGYIKKSIAGDERFDWAWRVYYGARFMQVYENNTALIKDVVIKSIDNAGYDLERIVNYMGDTLKNNTNIEYIDFIADYKAKYTSKYSTPTIPDIFTEEAFNAYKTSTYSLNDLKKDIRALSVVVNTPQF